MSKVKVGYSGWRKALNQQNYQRAGYLAGPMDGCNYDPKGATTYSFMEILEIKSIWDWATLYSPSYSSAVHGLWPLKMIAFKDLPPHCHLRWADSCSRRAGFA